MSNEIEHGFLCSICGQRHNTLPFKYSVKAPHAVTAIPLDELEKRVVFTRDQCVIDGRDFYLRGRILIPIIDRNETFVWGVWAEVSPKNFIRSNDLWHTPGREQEPPFPGWLNNELPLYGNTINLEVGVHTQIIGQRPRFRVTDKRHPLAIEQHYGITLQRVEEIAAIILHAEDKKIAEGE